MLASLATLQETQVARAVTAPLDPHDTAPVAAALEALRRRNALLDTLFYDVSGIAAAEALAISPWLAREGALLYVPPGGAGDLRLCADLDALHAAGAVAGPVRGLAVAGVGSSALGSAAFARNVADALGAPVVAVVSGYGLADLASEALGGWLFFGALNRLRHFEQQLEALLEHHTTLGAVPALFGDRRGDDTAAVLAILRDPRFRLDLLTGHSKGNLVLSEALYALVRSHGADLPIAPQTRIVTLSAVIAMPPAFTDIVDVMGEWDWFGAFNSRAGIPVDVSVPQAWHHTNTELPFHLPVTATFKRLL
ncbi:MAG: hypothetical protein Kow00114_34050 [Kiloniellaceae bacterium]